MTAGSASGSATGAATGASASARESEVPGVTKHGNKAHAVRKEFRIFRHYIRYKIIASTAQVANISFTRWVRAWHPDARGVRCAASLNVSLMSVLYACFHMYVLNLVCV